MRRPKGKIIERCVLCVDGQQIQYPIRLIKSGRNFSFTAIAKDFDLDVKSDDINELKVLAEKEIREKLSVTWEPFVSITTTSEIIRDDEDVGDDEDEDYEGESLAERIVGDRSVSIDVEFFVVGTTQFGDKMHMRVSSLSILDDGTWNGVRSSSHRTPEIGGDLKTCYKEKPWSGRNAETIAVLKVTPEIMNALLMFQGALAKLGEKIHDFIKPEDAERNLMSVPFQKLLTGGCD